MHRLHERPRKLPLAGVPGLMAFSAQVMNLYPRHRD
jgi:hypothetical protein